MLPTVQAGGARRVLSGHVLGAGRLPLLDAQVGNVERRARVHVVRAELVAQRPVPFRTRQRQVVQLEFVALVPVDSGHLCLHGSAWFSDLSEIYTSQKVTRNKN